ncbi:probable palmitoyltransferase ZDHHC24 [Leptidea sinapis]|uniref:probable palmitoyltransferase ZDHHC24 n=1 Tax=Leptidea sinapis TaxID=189913 RepID=UPI0021C27FBE|nr:probable palmitoyltransferase ZDHHC24 [Leptidea sinapis]
MALFGISLSQLYEKLICYTIIFVITPCFFIFEMIIVRPVIVKHYNMCWCKDLFHVCCATFCFINVIGNMILGIITDTSFTQNLQIECGSYCEHCKMNRPSIAWHCKVCNVCILRRDHHCFFFSRCIGLYNRRYFVLYLVYIVSSLMYATIYNYYYIATKLGDYHLSISILRFSIPYMTCLINEPADIKDLYVLFLMLNVGLVLWCTLLLLFHLRNTLTGLTAREYKQKRKLNLTTLKENLRSVFGARWYFAIFWPLVDSPIPDEYITKSL